MIIDMDILANIQSVLNMAEKQRQFMVIKAI